MTMSLDTGRGVNAKLMSLTHPVPSQEEHDSSIYGSNITGKNIVRQHPHSQVSWIMILLFTNFVNFVRVK